MHKQEFLALLCKGLSGLPREDIEERVSFYEGMIDDRMEEGLSEEEAVCEIGNIDEIISQIIADTPLAKLVKEKMKPRKKPNALVIVLLVLGAPLWLSLLLGAVAVLLSLYIAIWTVIISLWSVFASLAACGLAAVTAGIGIDFTVDGGFITGFAVMGAGIVCAGLAIFTFYPCKAATKGIITLTKKLLI